MHGESLSYGKVKTETTFCTLFKAGASIVQINSHTGSDGETANGALCIELVGNRFLRRMVRILVATALREGLDIIHGNSDMRSWRLRLLDIVRGGKRKASAKAAPPEGLLFVGAIFKTSANINP